MNLTPEELEKLRLVFPEVAAKLSNEVAVAVAEEDIVDDPVDPGVNTFDGVIRAESGEGRDYDTMLPSTVCPACARGGVPRRGALHNCGKPNPYIQERNYG